METAIYVRVSTEEQAQEGFSIRGQEQKLKDYARVKDWSIYNIYIDEGISGKNITDRPAINKMITDIKNGHIKNVVVFKIDRITRSTGDLAYLIDLFSKHGCSFNSLTESIDTQTPSGRMFIKMIGIFAEFERENIAERVRLGCERKVKEGYSLCGNQVSYGYDREDGQKIQTINEKEAPIVKQLFDWYVNDNMPLAQIAKRFNAMKIPTKNSNTWTANTVRTILTNCTYVGRVRYSLGDKDKYFEADGLHEPIITLETYNKAQKQVEKNKKVSGTKKPRDDNYFQGFLYCPECGSKLKTHGSYNRNGKGETIYKGAYRCRNKLFGNCAFPQTSNSKMEKAFIEYAQRISEFTEIDDNQLKQIQGQQDCIQEQCDCIQEQCDCKGTDTNTRTSHIQQTKQLIQTYKDKLNQLDIRDKEILSLYVDGNVPFDRYREIKDKIDKDRKEAHSELEKLATTEDTPPEFTREDFVLEFKANWEHLTNIEKRQFLMKFVKKIHLSAHRADNKHNWLIVVEDVEFA